jgi:hypothetical protein
MGIINAYLMKYVSSDNISRNGEYDVYARDLETGTLFRKTKTLALIVLKSDLLFLDEIVNLLAEYRKDKVKASRISFRILISSPKGSIYLYESITNDDIWRNRMKRHRVCVINSENGAVCITPGHARNAALSDRLKTLIEEYKLMNGMLFEREIFTAFNLCVEAMRFK